MKHSLKSVLVATVAIALAATSCKKDVFNGDKAAQAGPIPSLPVKHISGVIGNYTFDRDTVYKLDGIVYVSGGNKTLTIQSGTWITNGNKVAYRRTTDNPAAVDSIAGVLVITKGNKINAVGTPSAPIVFTSDKPRNQRQAGDFGGIFLLGNAPVNRGNAIIRGLSTLPFTPVSIAFGGCIQNDDSGSLQYVRIEFPGLELERDNEANGLTLAGVGSDTDIDHIQVSYSGGNAYDFLGGTVNAKYLIATGTSDDDFNFDWGYTGSIQFAIGLKDPNSTHSTSGSSPDANGIECDNQSTETSTVRPFTNPKLSNFTLLGYASNPATQTLEKGVHFRRSSSFTLKNSVIAGFPTGAHFENITQLFSSANYAACSLTQAADSSEYTTNVTHAFSTLFNVNPTAPFFYSSLAADQSTSTTPANFLRLGTTSPFYPGVAPYVGSRLVPASTSPAFSGANFSRLGAFFTATTYQGAVAPSGTNWATGTWIDWTPFNDATM